MEWITNRLNEPSSWAGIAAILLGFLGIEDASGQLGPEFWGALGVVITGLVALVKKSPNGKDAKK